MVFKENLETVKKLLHNEKDGMTINQLAETMGMTRETITKYIAFLEGEGSIKIKVIGNTKVIRAAQRLPPPVSRLR
jgi:DNA-binding transcriptional regulator LsrR (DeoR family)